MFALSFSKILLALMSPVTTDIRDKRDKGKLIYLQFCHYISDENGITSKTCTAVHVLSAGKLRNKTVQVAVYNDLLLCV